MTKSPPNQPVFLAGTGVDPALHEALKDLDSFLNIKSESQETDAIFVISSSLPNPAQKAAILFKVRKNAPDILFISLGKQYAPHLIDGLSHNVLYAQILSRRGVPKSVVLTADREPNTVTPETVVPFLESRGIRPQTVTLISRCFNQRRAWAILKKNCPGYDIFNQPAHESMNWLSPTTHLRLRQEVEQMENLAAAGLIDPQEQPPEVVNAMAYLRQMAGRQQQGS